MSGVVLVSVDESRISIVPFVKAKRKARASVEKKARALAGAGIQSLGAEGAVLLHSLTSPSVLPDASSVPSGERANAQTSCLCPFKTACSFQPSAVGCHREIVQAFATAMVLLSTRNKAATGWPKR